MMVNPFNAVRFFAESRLCFAKLFAKKSISDKQMMILLGNESSFGQKAS